MKILMENWKDIGGHFVVLSLRECTEATWDQTEQNALEIEKKLFCLRHNGKLMYFQI
jgi:hypothetical protein